MFEELQLCFQHSGAASGSAAAVIVTTGARTCFAASHGRSAGRQGASTVDRTVHGIS